MKSRSRYSLAVVVAFSLIIGAGGAAQAVSLPSAAIYFGPIAKATFGDPDKALSVSQTSGVTTVTSSTPGICSVTGKTVKILGAGICKLVASNPGSSTHKPARSVSKSFLISKAANTVTLSDFGWLSLANPKAELTTTQSVGTTILSSLTPTTCKVTNGTVEALKIGRCTVRASNPGNANFLAAKSITKSVTVARTSNIAPPQPHVGPWTIRQITFDDTNSWSNTKAANDWVSKGWYEAGLGYRLVEVEALSTTRIEYRVLDSLGRPTPNKLLNLSVGKRYASSNAKVRVGNESTSGVDRNPQDQLLVTGTTDALGVASFEITGLDPVARAGLYTQLAAWITGLDQDVIDITELEYVIPSGTGNGEDPTIDLGPPNGPIDSLFYQPCTGIKLVGQIANIDVDPVNQTTTVLSVTRGRPDVPSGIWDHSVLATLPAGSFISSNSKIVSISVYSPIAGMPILLRLQNTRTNHTKFIEVLANTTKANQWEVISFDFSKLATSSQPYSTTVAYRTLALVVNPGQASTGQRLFFKDFNFPGALIAKDSLTTSSTAPILSDSPTSNSQYLWAEEFNGASKSRPNSSDWKYALDWNNFIQGTQPDLVEQDGNGNLSIGMQKCADETWNGGIIHTLGRKAFLYGKIEARIKIAQDPGWFSAFYMFGEDVAHWPSCGEFDIQEAGPWNDFTSSGTIHGNNPNSTTAWNGGGGLSTKVPGTRAQLSADYHVFGLLWTPTSITFTLDNVPYRSFTKAQVLKDVGTWPFDVPNFLVFSVYPYVASLPSNTPVGTTLRGQVLVDWIHYSKHEGYGQVFDR